MWDAEGWSDTSSSVAGSGSAGSSTSARRGTLRRPTHLQVAALAAHGAYNPYVQPSPLSSYQRSAPLLPCLPEGEASYTSPILPPFAPRQREVAPSSFIEAASISEISIAPSVHAAPDPYRPTPRPRPSSWDGNRLSKTRPLSTIVPSGALSISDSSARSVRLAEVVTKKLKKPKRKVGLFTRLFPFGSRNSQETRRRSEEALNALEGRQLSGFIGRMKSKSAKSAKISPSVPSGSGEVNQVARRLEELGWERVPDA
ncbi:hypothetical protein BT69DRAFT_1329971 [Atractiella rhizophila]|nr:hypothetical protein BT69DRAFT_1329971 [Atractiella rhizophila]